MTAPIYSVVIPVYNAEKTLDRCVHSLLNQDNSDAEIILVDDGSNDCSPKMCDRFAQEDSSVRCIHQENQGVSVARNTGINAARGTFVMFVDSDDYVAPNYFQIIRDSERNGPWDLLQLSYEKTDGIVAVPTVLIPCTAADSSTAREYLIQSAYHRHINPPWAKVYRKSLLDQYDVRFPEGLSIGEDWAFNIIYALYAESYCAVSDVLYFINTENQNSLSRGVNPRKDIELSNSREFVRSRIQSSVLNKADKQRFNEIVNFGEIRRVYRLAKQLRTEQAPRSDRIRAIRKLCNEINQKKLQYPKTKNCRLMTIPVKMLAASLIDLAAKKTINQ